MDKPNDPLIFRYAENAAKKSSAAPNRLRPAATVIPVRETADGMKVLLLRRNPQLAFFGGAWVFPGGSIDAADCENADEDPDRAARAAAVREAAEEAGLALDPETFIPFSFWETPDGMPKRFFTWFFVAPVNGREVRIDGGEIMDYRWTTPREVLGGHGVGDMQLPPPIYVTLCTLSRYATFPELRSALATTAPLVYRPRVVKVSDGFCFLYEEDDAYVEGDPEKGETRHRLWALRSGWRYEPVGH